LTPVEQALDYWPHGSKRLEERLKSRILVWSLVGIVVIIGVIIIATAPRKKTSGPNVTLDMVKSDAAEAEVQLDRLVARLDARRKAIAPGTGTEAFADADQLLAETREKLGQVREATDLKQARELLMEGRRTLRKARRAVELATRPARRPVGM